MFDQLSSWVNLIFGGDLSGESALAAEIYRPMAETMTNPYFKEKAAGILDATKQAGRELATSLTVSEETMARVTQPMLDDPAVFFQLGNSMWRTCIAEGITPKEFGRKGMIPRPDSIESYIGLMKLGFNPAGAKGLHAKIQFNFSGDPRGHCFLEIADGALNAGTGTIDSPDLTVNSPFDIWMDILTGKAEGQQLFLEQKYTVEGDLELLMQMEKLFGGRP